MPTQNDSPLKPETTIGPRRGSDRIPRRDLFTLAAGAVVLGTTVDSSVVSLASSALTNHPGVSKLKYCLNTSTIHGEVIPIVEQVSIAQKAGYDSLEIWLRDVDKYTSGGGSLSDLRKRIADAGLTLESAIAFAPWILSDLEAHKKALEQAKKEMGRQANCSPSCGSRRWGFAQSRRRWRALSSPAGTWTSRRLSSNA